MPVGARRDNDDPGAKWEKLVRGWLEGHPVATMWHSRGRPGLVDGGDAAVRGRETCGGARRVLPLGGAQWAATRGRRSGRRPPSSGPISPGESGFSLFLREIYRRGLFFVIVLGYISR